MNEKKLPIGISDFRDVISGNYYYVDKTLFIKDIIDRGDKILLIPRPRRFGKTLNISMLAYFYDCCSATYYGDEKANLGGEKTQGSSNAHLFDSLAIAQAGQEYLDKMGKYPVIFLSFKDIKDEDWPSCLESLKKLIQREYLKHDYLLENPGMKAEEKHYFKSIKDLSANTSDYASSLNQLLIFLTRFYNSRAVILIDEYDTPIHEGFFRGYYDEIVQFMRRFMGGGLKDTDPYLEKGVVTGIMRIAKESFFSGLNNPGVYTMLSSEFNAFFGFTEPEVKTMLADFHVMDKLEQVQKWYNGYNFGGRVIFNPWSIINFLCSEEKRFKPYWINTSSNQIMEQLLTNSGKELKQEIEQLLSGETIEKVIDESIVLKDVFQQNESLWSFLLMGGYLKQSNEQWNSGLGKFSYTLTIPNEEVKVSYTQVISRYFSDKISNQKLEIMLNALIIGDINLFEKMLKQMVLTVFSYHDFAHEPEKVYHALVAGLLIWLTNTHEVKSNRESGYGRYDIMIIPKDKTKIGYVIEFKAVDTDENETVETALETALTQITKKQYTTELKARGLTRIKKLAIVFLGKNVFLRCQD